MGMALLLGGHRHLQGSIRLCMEVEAWLSCSPTVQDLLESLCLKPCVYRMPRKGADPFRSLPQGIDKS